MQNYKTSIIFYKIYVTLGLATFLDITSEASSMKKKLVSCPSLKLKTSHL